MFAPYLKADKVRSFDDEHELFPGIRPLRMPGHTPGHTFYEISSEGQRLQLWGDTIHAQHLQFPEPGVAIDFDVDSTAAVKMRKRAMADAAAKGYWVGGYRPRAARGQGVRVGAGRIQHGAVRLSMRWLYLASRCDCALILHAACKSPPRRGTTDSAHPRRQGIKPLPSPDR